MNTIIRVIVSACFIEVFGKVFIIKSSLTQSLVTFYYVHESIFKIPINRATQTQSSEFSNYLIYKKYFNIIKIWRFLM